MVKTTMSATSSIEWPADFWPEFIQRYWETHPYHFNKPAPPPFINKTELFKVVTNMPARTPSDRFWIVRNAPPKTHNDFIMGSLDLLGPHANDTNFEGYFKRLSRHTAGINIHNLDAVKPELWQRVNTFIEQLSHTPDQPAATHWGLDTFIGTYQATPFGIHRDNASVFSFVLQGQRTYVTWPADYFSPGDPALQTPDMEKIAAHLPYAETFLVSAGDVFYWPSNRWHVVLSDGTPSITAQISAYFDVNDLHHWARGNS